MYHSKSDNFSSDIFILNSLIGITRKIALNYNLDFPLDSDCFCSAFFFFLF